jgi:protein-S-isoprenylcysteine O-methyltransferase Ste14
MDHDSTFRLVLLVGFLVLIPIGIFHRVQSQRTGEQLDRRAEGLFILLTVRPAGLVTAAALIAYIVQPSAMAWSSVQIPLWLRWFGVGLGVIAGALLTWTLRTLGNNLTDTVVTRREHTLVTHGPYAWIRHPFYASFALAVLANALVAANWFILVSGAVTFALLAIRCTREEEQLIARFGNQYAEYMKRTHRFIPRTGRQ